MDYLGAVTISSQLAADPAARAAQTARKTAALSKRLRQIDTAETAATDLEALAHTSAPARAHDTLRTRILARFTELEDERETINQ